MIGVLRKMDCPNKSGNDGRGWFGRKIGGGK